MRIPPLLFRWSNSFIVHPCSLAQFHRQWSQARYLLLRWLDFQNLSVLILHLKKFCCQHSRFVEYSSVISHLQWHYSSVVTFMHDRHWPTNCWTCGLANVANGLSPTAQVPVTQFSCGPAGQLPHAMRRCVSVSPQKISGNITTSQVEDLDLVLNAMEMFLTKSWAM